MYRFHCLRRPEALAKVLLSARWNLQEDVVEIRKYFLHFSFFLSFSSSLSSPLFSQDAAVMG